MRRLGDRGREERKERQSASLSADSLSKYLQHPEIKPWGLGAQFLSPMWVAATQLFEPLLPPPKVYVGMKLALGAGTGHRVQLGCGTLVS